MYLYAGISPAFEATVRRRETKARAAAEAGEFVTARNNYFHKDDFRIGMEPTPFERRRI